MRSSKRVWWALAIAPLLIGLSGCSEENEKGAKVEGATTAPDAAASSADALKQGETVKPGGMQAPAGKSYPGAKK